MRRKLHFFIIDDDRIILEKYAQLLEKAGHKVTTTLSSEDAFEKIIDLNPDCVLCDLILPAIDGLELFQKLRQVPDIKQPIFIIITAKQFEYDKRQALELGVDGYLIKPLCEKNFLFELLEIINEKMIVEFWGCHGTLPVPGPNTVYYGGNTNCVTLKLGKKHFFIFDAGTGIKALSNALLEENKFPLSAKIFISHSHYDHINGIPFFMPLYMKGNKFEILGANQSDIPFEQVIGHQMDSIYFPVTMKEFTSQVTFRSLSVETLKFGDVVVKTIFLNHPGRCLGFRIEYKEKIFCYVTDNELYLKDSPAYNRFNDERLIAFIQNTDILVIDTTYDDETYQKKVGWGHSSVSRVVDIADEAKVKLLCLYHHDPDDTDIDIDRKFQHAKSLLKEKNSKTKCIAPREGEKIVIDLFPLRSSSKSRKNIC